MSDDAEQKTNAKTLTATQGTGASVTMAVQKSLTPKPVKVESSLVRDISWLPKPLRRAADGLKYAGAAAHVAGDFVVKHVPGIGMAAGFALEHLSKVARKRGVRHRRESS